MIPAVLLFKVKPQHEALFGHSSRLSVGQSVKYDRVGLQFRQRSYFETQRFGLNTNREMSINKETFMRLLPIYYSIFHSHSNHILRYDVV